MQKLNTTIAFCLLLLFGVRVEAQISYNKRGGSNVGQKPELGNLLNSYSLEGMDLASGTLQVGIPLYEIKVNDIVVPISLNYTATGLKANQKAGVVGMGWELNAGGKISVGINGLPDDDYSKGLSNTYNNTILSQIQPYQLDIGTNVDHRTFALKTMNNVEDGAWDISSYSLPNGNGRFINKGNNFITFPYNPLVKYTNRGFTIGDGLYYEFAAFETKTVEKRTGRTKTNPPTFTQDFYSDYGPYVATKYLTKIFSARHTEEVNFQYVNRPSDPGNITWTDVTNTVSTPLVRSVSYNSVTGAWVANNSYDIKEPSISQTKVTTDVKRLYLINYKGGRVGFGYESALYQGQDVLNNIVVEQQTADGYRQLKRFNFIYDKTYAHYLTAINVYDDNDVLINHWNFDYYDRMPVYRYNGAPESNAQDRWGFYNGKTDNQSLVERTDDILALKTKNHHPVNNYSNMTISTAENHIFYPGRNILSFADRNFVFSEALKGTLKSVRTPTGSIYQYEYEPHKFQLKSPGSNSWTGQTGGGIRLKQITTRMTTGQMISRKEFRYGLEASNENADKPILESGYGMVAFPQNLSSTDAVYGTNGNQTALTVQNIAVLSHATNDINYSAGSYGMYRSVTEYLVKDTAGTTDNQKYSGKTISFFYLPDVNNLQTDYGSSLNNLSVGSGLSIGVENDHRYGKLEKMVMFRINPSGLDPVKRTTYSYTNYQAPTPANSVNSFFCSTAGVQADYYSSPAANFTIVKSVFVSDNNGGGHYERENVPMTIQANNPVDPLFFANIEFEQVGTYYPGKYVGAIIPMHTYSNQYKLATVYDESFGDQSPFAHTAGTTTYTYNLSLQATKVKVYDSNGKTKIQRTSYPLDYTTQQTSYGLPALRDAGIAAEPIEQLTLVEQNGNEKIIGGVFNEFSLANNLINLSTVKQLNTGGIPINYVPNDGQDSRYETRKQLEQYDLNGNLLQFSEDHAAKTSLIYGYGAKYPIAQVINAPATEIAYSGFESNDLGNWSYSTSARVATVTPIGKYAFNLSSSSVTKGGLNASTTYLINYWLKDDASVTITGGTVSNAVIKRSLPGWKYIERKFSGGTTINIAGTGNIDELRLYPVGAQMSTYTYEPNIGISTVTDAVGQTEYYEYDSFQRLMHIKDQKGNIIKKVAYNYEN